MSQNILFYSFLMIVFLVLVVYPLYQMWKNSKKKEEIRAAAKVARAEEEVRVKRVKRLARQDQAGDRIFSLLFNGWKDSGSPENLLLRRVRHDFGEEVEGPYYIEVVRLDLNQRMIWINIDLRCLPKEVKFVSSCNILGGCFSVKYLEGWLAGGGAQQIFAVPVKK